jgi:Putative adhesin
MVTGLRSSGPLAVLCGVILVTIAGCDTTHPGRMNATASDDWNRRYPLTDGGELQVVGASGSIEVTGGSGTDVEVRAERIARASTDAAARELLPRIRIREDIQPEKIVLQTEGLAGLVIGVEVAVHYHVTLPASARVHLRTDGGVQVANMSSHTVVAATNGAVAATGISGGLEVRAVNGDVTVDLAAVGSDPIELRSTNGNLALTLPKDANAYLLANFTNGTINMDGVNYEQVGEQTRRRARGRINAGGTPIELTSVNGNIQIRPRP